MALGGQAWPPLKPLRGLRLGNALEVCSDRGVVIDEGFESGKWSVFVCLHNDCVTLLTQELAVIWQDIALVVSLLVRAFDGVKAFDKLLELSQERYSACDTLSDGSLSMDGGEMAGPGEQRTRLVALQPSRTYSATAKGMAYDLEGALLSIVVLSDLFERRLGLGNVSSDKQTQLNLRVKQRM